MSETLKSQNTNLDENCTEMILFEVIKGIKSFRFQIEKKTRMLILEMSNSAQLAEQTSSAGLNLMSALELQFFA